MNLSVTMITKAIQVASEVFNQQTVEDLNVLKGHFGQAYSEVRIISEIAVKLVLRLAGLPIETDGRDLSPVDALVYDAAKVYAARTRR